MTGLLGRGSNAKQATAAGSLQFQTSQQGGVIPLVYGTTRVAPNLLDQQDFTATPAPTSAKGKGGGAGKGGTGQFNYSASVILGVCQGPIAEFGLVWWDKNIAPLIGLPGISYINLGNDAQAPSSYWSTVHPANAIGYSGTAYFEMDNYQLGMSPTLPNFNVEVIGLLPNTGPNNCDANPAAIVTDFLTNARYGAGFPSANLDALTSYRDYCNAAGIWLAPMMDQQQEAQQSLADIVQLTNSAIVWSGGLLKIIPYGDQPLSTAYILVALSGTITELDTLSLTFTAAGLTGSPVTVTYQAQPAEVNSDTTDYSADAAGLASAINGNADLAAFGITAGSGVSTCVIALRGTAFSAGVSVVGSSTGAASFTVTGPTAYSWTPNTTVEASLGEDDFIVQESSVGIALGPNPGGSALRQGATPITGGFTDDPVHVTRASPADADNYIQLECLDRANAYNTTIVDAFDQGSIDLYGVRKNTSLKARAITDFLGVAPIVAQLVLQRGLLYRNTYSFRLGWKYCLLEPMDLVEISDARLGLSNQIVRITAIEEDEEGTLSVTAEDFFGTTGGATAVLYPKQGTAPTAFNPNTNFAAASINAPFILEPTGALLAAQGITSPQLIVGLSAGPNGAFDPKWGGCQIYASLDEASFGLQGTFEGRSTMGVTTAELSPTGSTLSVDLSESDGSLASVSAEAAAAGVSLCALRAAGGELEYLSFTTATLTGPNRYDLTGLNRGLYGTFAVDQPAGAQFLYLASGSYYRQTLPTQYVGRPLFFKFPSFNITGGGQQALADAVAYAYTPLGAQVNPGSFPLLIVADTPAPTEARSQTVRADAILPIESR
jgi:hypothetical protein